MTTPARYSQLKPGDIIIADEGFECMAPGKKVVQEAVMAGHHELYVECEGPSGRHYLDAQIRKDGTLEGFTLPDKVTVCTHCGGSGIEPD